jgi:DNA-binding response OmpR family regulator
VDDDRAITRAVRACLERDAFRVEVAFGGSERMREVHREPPALIVLDWMLPDIDGLEFLKRLRVGALRLSS